ncbi:hypothetical protein ACLB2K_018142 [Fragaria x ananassa]
MCELSQSEILDPPQPSYSQESQPQISKMRKKVKQNELEHDEKPYILQLPNHIIVEIFCKIPIKTPVKCRFFNKDLFSQKPAYLLVTESRIPLSNPTNRQLLVDWDNASSPRDAALKVSEELTLGRRFVGVCNGLLCHYLDFHMRPVNFYISNPITGESVPLSCPPEETSFDNIGTGFGFGYSPKCQVYKVVVLMSFARKVMVLTVGSGSWRSISYPGYGCEQQNGIYVKGYLHWMGKCSKWIHSFNLESETFEQLPLPPCCLDSQRAKLNLGVSNDCLSVTVRGSYYISLWVMKDYGVKESWTKEVDIREIIGGVIKHTTYSPARVLEYTKERQVLVLKGKLQSYTPKDGFVMSEFDGIPYIHDAVYVRIQGFVVLKDLIRGSS